MYKRQPRLLIKAENTVHTKVKSERLLQTGLTVDLTQVYRIRKSQQIQVNLSIMRLTARAECYYFAV